MNTSNEAGVTSISAKGLVSRILFNAVIPLGVALLRTLISDLPGGFGNNLEPPCRIGPMRSGAWLPAPASLPIWSCSVWGLPCLQPYGVSGALLPHLFTLTTASGSPLDESIGRHASSGGMFSVALAVHGT